MNHTNCKSEHLSHLPLCTVGASSTGRGLTMREVVNVKVKLEAKAELTTFWEVRWESCKVHKVLTCIACR